MRKSFAMILNILVTLIIIAILYKVMIKMNFGTSLQNKDVPAEFKGNPSPVSVFQKSKDAVSAINARAKERDQEATDALGR